MTKSRDECVVPSEPLSQLVTGFVDRWSATRPATAGRFDGRRGRLGDRAPLGALDWLSTEASVPRRTIENLVGRPRYPTTELGVADALVAAIGCPEAFHNGTLPIVQNPHVKKRACCNGSLLGS